MKTKIIFIVAGVLAVVGGVWFAFLPKQPVNRIKLERGAPAVPLLQTFDTGSAEFLRRVPYAKSCAEFAGHRAMFCGEGYAFEQARGELSRSSDSAVEIYRRLRGSWTEERPNLAGVYDVAFGLAMADVERAPEELLKIQSAIPGVLFTYVVDGWALRYSAGHGARETMQVCDKILHFAFHSICSFGVGRGTFFYPEIKNDLPRETDISAGYDFASTFAKERLTPDEIRRSDSPAHKVIEVLKYKVDERPLEDRDFQPMYECLAREHVSVCMAQPLKN
jgi:hypothetical protein